MVAIIPQVSRLSSRIIRVLGCNPGAMTLQGTNTYLIGTGKRRILLDTGDKNVPEYTSILNKIIQDENVDLEHIIITHWHNDHIGGLHDILNNVKTDCLVWKFPRSDVADAPLPLNFPLNFVKDGEEITTEGATLKIHHTPGHTTDHIVLSLVEENSLFSGDCILGEGTAVFEDLYDYMASLKKIYNLKPLIIYPGHGPVIEDPLPKIQYYIDHRNKREEQILAALAKGPVTTMDLVKTIYTDTPAHLHLAAAYNVDHHLNKLLKENRVTQSGSLWLPSSL